LDKKEANKRIGNILQDAVYAALHRLQDREIVFGVKWANKDKLPDFLVLDRFNRLWDLECKNLKKYPTPTHKRWYDTELKNKQWHKGYGRILVISFFQFDDETSRLVLKKFHSIVELEAQIDVENYLPTLDALEQKFAVIFGSKLPTRFYKNRKRRVLWNGNGE
jgi:hypothetical protein